MHVATDQTLKIADHGEIEMLDYAGLLNFHQGDSWFGLSVGFRVMQIAGRRLSTDRLWDRRELYVVSHHPGAGVRDAIEYVTRSISRDRYRLAVPEGEPRCSRHMEFEWQVSDGAGVVDVRLRPGFVPEAFFELLDRRGTGREQDDDRRRFDELKRELSKWLWSAPFAESFEVQVRRAPVASHA